MPRSGDPLEDFHNHEMMKEALLKRMPKCQRCRKHIQQDRAVCIDGQYYCDECLDELKVWLDGDD